MPLVVLNGVTAVLVGSAAMIKSVSLWSKVGTQRRSSLTAHEPQQQNRSQSYIYYHSTVLVSRQLSI
jgi:hypothetical protein